MTHAPTFTIQTANDPQQLSGARRDSFCLGIRCPTTNTSSLFLGSTDDQSWELQPGDIVTFNAGECDLRDDWSIKGATAGDKYTIMLSDIESYVRQHREGSR